MRNKYVVTRNSTIHGRGLYARRLIEEGTKVIEYAGEKVPYAIGDRRDHERVLRGESYFTFELTDKTVVDGGVGGNISRFANHSCSPNCYAQISMGKIWFYALRDIQPGEEVTINYGFTYTYGKHTTCKCGSPNCVGHIMGESEHWKVRRFLKKS